MKTAINGKWTAGMNDVGCVRPLWMTEVGFSSGVLGESGQGTQMVSAINMLFGGQLNAQRLIFYRLEDHLAPGTGTWGITRQAPTYSLKPAYQMFESAIWDPCWVQ